MQSVTHTFARRYDAEPQSVAQARAGLARFASRAGASETLVDAIRLAVSEAVTNAVRHAYPAGPGEVRVSGRVGGDVLEVVVSDDGCGIHRDGDSVGGLRFGLALICEVSDQMTVAPRSERGTDVRMRFDLLGSYPGADGADRAGAERSGAAVGRL